MKRIFLLKGLDCPNCSAKIEKEVGELDGVQSSVVNLMKQTLTINVTQTAADTIASQIETIVHSHEPDVEVSEIAQEIGIEKEMIVYALDAIQNPVSLFEPVYTEGGDTLYVMDQISDKKNKEERWIENLALREAMQRLNSREKHIIELRFYEGKTQMEVAQEIGISQAQVSRLEKNALKSMRNYLRPLNDNSRSVFRKAAWPNTCQTALHIF